MVKGEAAPKRHPARRRFLEQTLGYVVAGGVAVMPLFCLRGHDGFRLPKEIAYRGEAILIVALVLTALLLRGSSALRSPKMPRTLAILITAIAGWALIAAAASTNRMLSIAALAYGAAALIVFGGTYIAVAGRSIEWVLVPVAVGAVPNAILAILQATSIWDPFHVESVRSVRGWVTALLGNPDDVGSYLIFATLFMSVAALATKRWWWWVLSGIAGAGVIASGALTAIVALVAGFFVLALLAWRRTAWISIGAIVLTGVLLASLAPPLRQRTVAMRQALRRGDYLALTSYRVYGVGPAWLMFTSRPLTGVGPGAFKFNYLVYLKDFVERHPWSYLGGGPTQNFNEVHCDHLQILAEEGLPGYALFLGALVMLSRVTLRSPLREETTPRLEFIRLAALPLAVSLGILALAAFPLELAAPTQLILHVIAAIACWSSE